MSPPRLTDTKSAPTATGSHFKFFSRSAEGPYVNTCGCSSKRSRLSLPWRNMDSCMASASAYGTEPNQRTCRSDEVFIVVGTLLSIGLSRPLKTNLVSQEFSLHEIRIRLRMRRRMHGDPMPSQDFPPDELQCSRRNQALQ